MQIRREVSLDAPVEDVWRFLADPEELARWLGDDVRAAAVTSDEVDRRLSWTWSPNGVESTVELTVTEDGDRTCVQVVERSAGGAAATCSVARWDGALLDLELRALTWQHRLARV